MNTLRKAVYDLGVRSRRTRRILCKQAVARVLANPIYAGSFIWKGKTHDGTHTPLVTRDLFERANGAMGLKSRPKKNKHDFAFTGMVRCGHCGASLTAEVKKAKYIYYRCAKQCENVVYVPENKLALQLGEALRRIKMTPEIVEWTRDALLSSHADQAEHHRAKVARLNARKEKLTRYLDQAYTDRLEGRIGEEMWQRRSAEWEAERADLARQLAALETAKTNYLASGVKLLELAKRAHDLYVSQSPREQRRLLNVVVSNCTLRDGTVEYSLRKPFDLLANLAKSDNWRRGRDSKRPEAERVETRSDDETPVNSEPTSDRPDEDNASVLAPTTSPEPKPAMGRSAYSRGAMLRTMIADALAAGDDETAADLFELLRRQKGAVREESSGDAAVVSLASRRGPR